MKFLKRLSVILYPAILFFSCVKENSNPPGCITPSSPVISYNTAEVTIGQDIVLDAAAPAGEEDGAFEWQGPNKYFLSQPQAVIKNAKKVHEGEYKLYYLNKTRCRSLPATVNILVYDFNESCGLKSNFLRLHGHENKLYDLQETSSPAGNYAISAETDSAQLKIYFPEKTRPNTDKMYSNTKQTGSQLAASELDILLQIKGEWYSAQQIDFKTINVFFKSSTMHIAFCDYPFASSNGDTTIVNAHIVIQK